MTSFNVDENGVPILAADSIELKVEEVISHFNKNILDKPQRPPLLEFIEEFNTRFNLLRDYSKNLGTTKYGNVILGKTQFKPLGLYVDVSLSNDPRFNFVLGHELGHVVLHRTVDIKCTGYEQQELIDTEIDLVAGKKNLRTPREWLEWQANYFSSAILMPRFSVRAAVIAKQKEMDIRRNLGYIILEAKPYSINDYKAVKTHLGLVHEVNATNVECRLKDLGILIDRMDMNVKHISELFTTD